LSASIQSLLNFRRQNFMAISVTCLPLMGTISCDTEAMNTIGSLFVYNSLIAGT